nr:hypothetical protein [Caballeronia sp. SBC1]
MLNLPLQDEQLALGDGFLVQQRRRFHLHLLLTLRHFALLRPCNGKIGGQALRLVVRDRNDTFEQCLLRLQLRAFDLALGKRMLLRANCAYTVSTRASSCDFTTRQKFLSWNRAT